MYVNRDSRCLPFYFTNFIFVGDKWPGPALPTPLYGHCLQKLNRRHFVLIGGHDGKNPISKVSFFDGSQWIEGPNLRIRRKYHSCALLHSLLVVAGGETLNGGITAEVEFLNLEEDSAQPDLASPQNYRNRTDNLNLSKVSNRSSRASRAAKVYLSGSEEQEL